jgi:hypothetical protein
VRNLEGNSIEICEEPIGSPGSPTSRVIAGNRETELIRGRFFYPSAESGATCTLFAEHGFLTIRFRLIQALRFPARGPLAERRGFFSTSLPSAHPPHRAKIGLAGGPGRAGLNNSVPAGFLVAVQLLGHGQKRDTRVQVHGTCGGWKIVLRNRTGRWEVVQCPSSLFLSFRKYARMRHRLVN